MQCLGISTVCPYLTKRGEIYSHAGYVFYHKPGYSMLFVRFGRVTESERHQ